MLTIKVVNNFTFVHCQHFSSVNIYSVITLPKILEILCQQGKLEDSVVKETEKFIQENSFSAAAPPSQEAADKTSTGDNAATNEKKRARKVNIGFVC